MKLEQISHFCDGSTFAIPAAMSEINNYRDLIAWQKAMDLVILVYNLTEGFPVREHFCLAREMRKSGISIPSNISEGHSQRHGAFVRHLFVGVGSHSELSTQSEIAFRLGYIAGRERNKLEDLLGHVGRLTQGLLNSQLALSPDAYDMDRYYPHDPRKRR